MRIHFIGVGGSGMSGVAELAREMGYEVTGCDLEKSSAYSKNISQGHNPRHIVYSDLVVVSPAVLYQNDKNPEVLAAKKKNILVTWQEFLGKYLVKDKKVICVAGTHGKSTTTAMAAELLINAGLDPTAIIGAYIPEWHGNSRFGEGEYAVIEADEFNDNFLNYSPEIIVLNNIEFDHPDYFKNEEQVFRSFEKFIKNLRGSKILIANVSDSGIQKLLPTIDLNGAKIVKTETSKSNIDLKLKVPGKHNIYNATMVFALGNTLGIKEDIIKKSLSNFKGIGRRLELIKSKDGVEVYDDYAHHPTAIKATLQAIRESHPTARILAIDEPHGFARTNALINLYNGAFERADRVFIGPIFKARDNKTFGMNSEIVSNATGHKNSEGFKSFEEMKRVLKKEIKSGDVVLIMGAGKSYLWAREIADLIK